MGLLPQRRRSNAPSGPRRRFLQNASVNGTFRLPTLSYQRLLELGKRVPGRGAITGVCDVRHFAGRGIWSGGSMHITRVGERRHDARVMCEIPAGPGWSA